MVPQAPRSSILTHIHLEIGVQTDEQSYFKHLNAIWTHTWRCTQHQWTSHWAYSQLITLINNIQKTLNPSGKLAIWIRNGSRDSQRKKRCWAPPDVWRLQSYHPLPETKSHDHPLWPYRRISCPQRRHTGGSDSVNLKEGLQQGIGKGNAKGRLDQHLLRETMHDQGKLRLHKAILVYQLATPSCVPLDMKLWIYCWFWYLINIYTALIFHLAMESDPLTSMGLKNHQKTVGSSQLSTNQPWQKWRSSNWFTIVIWLPW